MFGKRTLLILTFMTFLIATTLYFKEQFVTNNQNITPSTQQLVNEEKPMVTIGDVEISVEIAKTPGEKSRGLSGRKSLEQNSGMLFIFERPSLPSFWMKDMFIPLDIVWISDNEITDIHENVPPPKSNMPDSTLPLYTPKKPINYVLEVNAGFTEKNDIEIGNTVSFSNI